ncbi:MAG: T9SS type A sorting domain-containing protein [Flavobacteriales bacterium]
MNPVPELNISSSDSNDIICNSDSITLIDSGGYSYAWSGGVVNGVSFIPSVSQWYSVTATSGEGCTAEDSIFITVADLPILSLAGVDIACFLGKTGEASANVTSGTTPYSYAWSNSDTTSTITALVAGSYSITVTDSNGCIAEDSVTLTEPSFLLLTQNILSTVQCFGGNDGSASITASGGTPGYSYAWNTGATVSTISNVTAGTYTVTVTDANGCTNTSAMSITQPQVLNANLNTTHEVCLGEMNGSIAVNAFGGTQPYAYLWSNTQVSATAINLQPGNYTVTITDDHDCLTIKNATVNPGNPLPTPDLGADTIVTNGQSITLDAGNFDSYNWQDGSSAQTFTATVSGTYWVQAFDDDGCMGADTINVTIWPTGINEGLSRSISIYPNPAQDRVHVRAEVSEGIIHLRLENAMGQVISTTSMAGNSISDIELGSASGVYILYCTDAMGKSSSHKVIKE